MISRIHLDNYRCFSDFDFEPKPVNLLLGNHGAGKTALMTVLCRWVELMEGKADLRHLFPHGSTTRWRSLSRQQLSVELRWAGQSFTYQLRVDQADGRPRVLSESVTLDGEPLLKRTADRAELSTGVDGWQVTVPPDSERSTVAEIVDGRLHPGLWRFRQALSSISWLDPGAAEGIRDQPDLASWLWHRARQQPELRADFREQLQDLYGVELDLSYDEHAGPRLSLRHDIGGASSRFGFDELSRGWRALFTAHALSHWRDESGAALMLNQPDLFMALNEIQPWLIRLVDHARDHGVQLFIASHRSETVSYLAELGGWWLDRPDGRATRIRPLDSLHRWSDLPLADLLARGWLE